VSSGDGESVKKSGFLQDIKGPFCDHPFPVVTEGEISDLRERFGRKEDREYKGRESLCWHRRSNSGVSELEDAGSKRREHK
jgi:hypothetical protein